MMKKILTLMLMAAVFAAAAANDNLINNGIFNAEQSDFPDQWTPVAKAGVEYSYDRTGGPGGKPAITMKGRGTMLVRQNRLFLIAGEKYRLSGYFKTKNLKFSRAGVAIINRGWKDEQGIAVLPENSDWQYHEIVLDAIDSDDGIYGVIIQIRNGSGELQAADLKLEALTEAGRKGRAILLEKLGVRKLVPLGILQRIPTEQPNLAFEWAGVLGKDYAQVECVFNVPGKAEMRLPLDDGRVRVDLSGLAAGEHVLLASIHEKGGQEIYREEYKIKLVESFKPGEGFRQLNNLVAELLNRKVSGKQELEFVHPRDGWVFVKVAGAPVKVAERTVADEGFMYLPAGRHALSATGAGTVTIRSVPEMLNYPPCRNSYVNVNGNGVFDWEFMKKYVLQALTTHNGGSLPGDALTESHERGLRWLPNFSKKDMKTLPERLAASPGLTGKQYDGVALDEFFFYSPKELYELSEVLRNYLDSKRLIYTWIVGKPSLKGLDTDFISTALNVSQGHGRLLYEAYAHPQPDEVSAAAYLEGFLNDAVRKYNEFFPGAVRGMGMIFGNFTQLPVISLDYLPEVDYKYYLDMQLNVIANSPDFKGLECTGFWGSYYADEEMYRWSFRLLRHYAVEGKKEMLSPEYGFKYNPGSLRNGDFTEGLKYWTYTGQVSTDAKAGYGKVSQGRWQGGNDTFCTMTRGETPNTVSQTAQGLTPGKLYSLHFAVAGYDDVMQMKSNPRRLPIEVELDQADIIPEKCYVYIDNRAKDQKKGDYARINLHRIVFRAKSESCRIEFHDRAASAGEKQVVNYIALRPYFAE